MLDGITTDSLEAQALSFNLGHVDIFSASWGPNDNGKSLEKPGRLASAALQKGVNTGRGGKGTIYVWASGNGGFFGDNCNCDGYTSSIFTISISSASESFKSPWYAERCASTMASAYSSGTKKEMRVTTSDLHNTCTKTHSGTSASAPLAAGIFALLLEANPSLTWRDVQHLISWTSEYWPLRKNEGWARNSAGFYVNTRFGFGMLNAASLVHAANPSTFTSVPPKAVCLVDAIGTFPAKMESRSVLSIHLFSDGCQGNSNVITYLEHVILILDMTYSKRGNIKVVLISPAGMRTELLTARREDTSKEGFKSWELSSVHNWGEYAQGLWMVEVIDEMEGSESGQVKKIKLELHGTSQTPLHASHGPRPYKTYF